MSAKVKIKPISVLKAELGITPDGETTKYMVKRCADYMDKYVPYRSGGLAYDTRKIEGNLIIYDAPYAHYMYEGLVMGPNIPIKEGDTVVGWFSPKGKAKSYTGKTITYKSSAGHEYAGPRWDKRMWTAEKHDLIKEIQDYINRGGK